MNESMDRVLAEWLREGPEQGPREALERTLAATRRTGQRPGWTLPERWFPMLLTMQRSPSLRPMAYLVVVAVILTAFVAAALIGSPPRLPDPFGPARNGAGLRAQRRHHHRRCARWRCARAGWFGRTRVSPTVLPAGRSHRLPGGRAEIRGAAHGRRP